MKKGVLWLVLLMCFVCVNSAGAAPSAQIAVTVTITQSVSVSVSPVSYAFGATDAGATLATAVDAFTATNDGNGAENLVIAVGNTADWTAATTVGTDQFVMNYYNGTAWSLIDPSTGAALAGGLAPAASKTFGLQLLVPSATSQGGVQQSINVTVTASAL
ncbi:MAG: hypothetical protein PHO30_04925 [Candidatus Omnitrophica bacterium]|nr:hypothetical protein [Candidatus Omnitrophota bacterium]